MRSTVRAVLGALAMSTIVSVAATAQGGASPGGLRIAYINSAKIIAQAPGRADADAEIQKDMASYRAQVQQMGDSLNTMIAAYNKAEPTLSAAAKAARQKDLQQKEAAYQQRVSQLEQEAQQKQAEVYRPIMEQINKIIEQIRNEEGYAMVFDAGNQAGVVVAADSSLDITDKVLARLKAAGPSAAPTSQTPASPPPAGPTAKPTGATRPTKPSDPR